MKISEKIDKTVPLPGRVPKFAEVFGMAKRLEVGDSFQIEKARKEEFSQPALHGALNRALKPKRFVVREMRSGIIVRV